ncbi:MAG: hypothetical protein CFE21_00565 [Bacteroidetes bacterium B1(2017)]|nr:MAG: hypothetical protein CFE21_00565 [Bacteroidetes bacterium B1(2017)]
MKKLSRILIFLMALSLTQTSCKKEESASTDNNTQNNNGFATIPSAFTKKALVEEYTGEWCVNCPDGVTYLKNISAKYPTQTIIAGVHQGDWLEISQLNTLSTHLGGIGGYPRASINRVPAQATTNGQDGMVVYSRGNWETNVARLIDASTTKTGKTGLAIESSLSGDNLNIKVHCGFTANETRKTYLTVYILENEITAINQIGATTSPYVHEHVLRKVVTAGTGDAIDMTKGNYVMKEFKDINISAYNKANVEVVAFINVIGSTSTTHEVLNVQKVKAGETKSYD